MIEYYPQNDTYLFGGVFEVIDKRSDSYELKEIDSFSKYVGRILCSFHRYQGMRGRGFYLEKHYDNFNVKQVFPEPYSGEIFPGYENVNHPFHMLEPIFQKEKLDWYAALRNVKGVYLISDKSNGRKYVGSAYGDSGIWQRWACYIGTGHGWNDELTHVIRKEEIDYARKNFVFIILDTMPMNTIDEKVIGRESFWKEALCSRSHGYNKN